MKFEATASFLADFKKVKSEHKAAFKKVARDKFSPAYDSWAAAQTERVAFVWPTSLRVDELRGTAGIMEMTWSPASPDGRATFQLIRADDEWICRWRRIGGHGVFGAT